MPTKAEQTENTPGPTSTAVHIYFPHANSDRILNFTFYCPAHAVRQCAAVKGSKWLSSQPVGMKESFWW